MKTKLLALMLLAAGSIFAQVEVGIRIGPPPPPRVVRVRPRAPGPDFVWVDGYWYPVGNHYKWHDGYWTRVPYGGARWVGPRYEGERFYNGYWVGERGRFEHDHRWDHDRDRDWRHDRDHDRH
jgi:YXWGXW repeat-containing protein